MQLVELQVVLERVQIINNLLFLQNPIESSPDLINKSFKFAGRTLYRKSPQRAGDFPQFQLDPVSVGLHYCQKNSRKYVYTDTVFYNQIFFCLIHHFFAVLSPLYSLSSLVDHHCSFCTFSVSISDKLHVNKTGHWNLDAADSRRKAFVEGL